MSDLINRQAAIDALVKLTHLDWKNLKIIHPMLDVLEQLPSAQPEIIHCRDCKHYYYADNRIPQEQRYTCDLDGNRWSADSFCSFAERREE